MRILLLNGPNLGRLGLRQTPLHHLHIPQQGPGPGIIGIALQDGVDMGLVLEQEAQAGHRDLRRHCLFGVGAAGGRLDGAQPAALDQLGAVA